ncbi:MAG: hypothetical protein QW038_01535 [Nanopusillaceae archaeon]
MVEIEIELVRPVNPAGRSFITYIYGAMAAKNREVIDKYKKEFTKLIQRLGFKIEETIGTGKLITGKIVISLDSNNKPTKAYTAELGIWNIEKTSKEKIEVTV